MQPLPPDIIEELTARILDAKIESKDSSYPMVFYNYLVRANRMSIDRELIDRIEQLQRSMTQDYPRDRYQLLIDGGFGDDAARQISAYHQPLDLEELQSLNTAVDRDDFLYKLTKTRPFLAANLKQLERNIHNTPFMVDRLIDLGFPEDMINRFVIYKSRRPRSSMASMVKIPKGKSAGTKFFGSDSTVLIDSSWLNKIAEVHQDSLFPVVRYGAEAAQGIYTQVETRRRDDVFCGTFYYYEVDSDIMLNARDILIAPNKICATAYLLGFKEVIRIIKADITVGTLVYPPYTVEKVFEAGPRRNSWEVIVLDMIAGRFDFLKHEALLYAVEDRFDQVLCNAAKDKFDLIVLTTMTGQERMVTEIMDTRNRDVSFSSLFISELDDSVYESV